MFTKIQNPSEVVFKSVAAAIVTSAFFWGGPCAVALDFAVGLPAILAVCGGVGGVVFVTLGASDQKPITLQKCDQCHGSGRIYNPYDGIFYECSKCGVDGKVIFN